MTQYSNYETFQVQGGRLPCGEVPAVHMTDGWYIWACFPGCLPDGIPEGPFPTEKDALEYWKETSADGWVPE